MQAREALRGIEKIEGQPAVPTPGALSHSQSIAQFGASKLFVSLDMVDAKSSENLQLEREPKQSARRLMVVEI